MIRILSSVNDMLSGAFPLVLLLTGAILHTFAPHHCMIVEERVKGPPHERDRGPPAEGARALERAAMAVFGAVLTTLLFLRADAVT